MSRGMTRQRDDLHAVDDWLGATKRVPLTGLDVRRCDGLRALEERLRILRRLSSDFRRQPKVAFGLRDVNIGIWKDALSVLSGQAADVIGMEVRDQNDADFFRRVACAAEAGRQAPECSPTPPEAITGIAEGTQKRGDGHTCAREVSRVLFRSKVAFGLREVNIGIWKDALSVLSGQAADVIGMEVRDQNDADFFRRVACAAEAARQAPECSPTPPGASTRIDED